MNNDDFWEKLAQGHTATTVTNAIDHHLSGRAFGEDFETLRGLTDAGRAKHALQLPVVAGTEVVFEGSLGAVLSYADAPEVGSQGTVVSVKSANGDITDYGGRVFVQWEDGQVRSIEPQHLSLSKSAKFPRGKKMTVDEVAAVVGEEFKEINENPPESVLKVREEMTSKKATRMTPAQMAEARALRDGIVNRGRMPPLDMDEYPPIRGMEGPFRFQSGRVLYYDPREGAYYDRKTDMYLDRNEKLATRQAKSEDDPCWEGYEMFGMKEKGDKKVPNCVPKKKATGSGRDYNPYASRYSFDQFKKIYFKDEPGIRNFIARSFWEDFQYAYTGPLGRYIAETTEDFGGSPRQMRASKFRVASLGDLTSFLKVAEGKLVHKSTKDLWAFQKDADGSLVVARLFDEDGNPLKV